MSRVNIFRYRPQQMSLDLFRSIARDLQVDGALAHGHEGMVCHNREEILAWSQPNARFGGVLFYADRSRSLAVPGKRLPSTEFATKYVDSFLERSRLTPIRGEHDLSLKLEARIGEAMREGGDQEGVSRLPMRVDVSSRIRLDDVPVVGPRAKVRAAFGDGETPQFLHVGLWETVEVHRTAELIPRDHLLKLIDKRARRREKKLDLRIRELTLAYWAREYRGGADLLEPYYFVEIEHLGRDRATAQEEGGPRHVLHFPACA